jgi:DNA-binding CsgD family transcriptional regulator
VDDLELRRTLDEKLVERGFAFAVYVRDLDDMAQLAAETLETIEPLGMTAAASGIVAGPKANASSPFHFTNWPESWLSYYGANDFLLCDPLPRWARNSGVPVTWSALIAALPPRDPGRQVVIDAKRFGFTEGMAIPMRSADNSVGLISVGGPRDTLQPAEQVFLTLVARAAFEAADRIERGGEQARPAPMLSARELECVVLVVRGHSDAQIAKLLGLGETTVRFHLRNAREKLGAGSRSHLSAIAVAQGYISL